ncbi:hypothetical protein BJY01DRAFT_71816 [Aspergillus pseudoustus]|uniref:Uncharacterized protein n=1 Tax=Aspergillus pseudoustus TaxID=1810923 RepID=A0ABR4L0B8_9EURO
MRLNNRGNFTRFRLQALLSSFLGASTEDPAIPRRSENYPSQRGTPQVADSQVPFLLFSNRKDKNVTKQPISSPKTRLTSRGIISPRSFLNFPSQALDHSNPQDLERTR